MDRKRTRIVCTIGPASSSVSTLSQMLRAGMNVARLNFSHGTHDEHKQLVGHLRKASEKTGIPVALLQDLQGPKIRVGLLPAVGIHLSKGEVILFTTATEHYKKDGAIPVTYKNLHKDVVKGHRILLDDGILEVVVERVRGRVIHTKVVSEGLLKSHKGMNLPDSRVSAVAFTKKDQEDLEFGASIGVDWVALSFVTSPDTVQDVRSFLQKRSKKFGYEVPNIIVKLERREAVDRFEEILDVADGIMIARGDLGIEIPPEKVPIIQKDVVEACRMNGKPVIVATHMLDSMTYHPRATRAETSDVANAVIDHTDAVMLSQETATGEFPVKTVETMAAIIREAESSRFDDIGFMQSYHMPQLAVALSQSLHVMSENAHIKAIVTSATHGFFARAINTYRPNVPLFVACPNDQVMRQWILRAGVYPFVASDNPSTFIQRSLSYLRKAKKIRSGERVAFVMASANGGFQLTVL